MAKKQKQSLEQWCQDNDREDLLRGGDSCAVEFGVKCHCLLQLALRLNTVLRKHLVVGFPFLRKQGRA